MAEELTNSQETTSEEIIPAEETTDVLSDADLEDTDSLTFSGGVVEKIVSLALRDVPNVVGARGNWLNRVQDVLGYAPQIFEDVKHTIVEKITGMTGLEVSGVSLRIEDVLTDEEYDRLKHRPEEPEQLDKEE